MRLTNARAAAAILPIVAAVMAGTSIQPAMAQPVVGHTNKAPRVQLEPSVPGHPESTLPGPADATAHRTPPSKANSWPAAGTATIALGTSARTAQARTMVPAGRLPVSLGLPKAGAGAGKATPSGSVNVTVLPHATAARAGLAGMLLRLRRTDAAGALATTMSVDYIRFRDAYGGDWAQRLQLVSLPACAATTPSVKSCRTGTILRSHNDATAHTVSAPVTATGDGALLALAASPSGSAGSYAATSLADAGTWQVSTQGGEFSWSYPMGVPDVPGGLEPTVAAAYSSSSVDGQTATTNNQPSWVGLGWDLGMGYIERSYTSCTDANPDTPADKTGDECWGTDNATMSLNGQSTPLVKVSNGVWHPVSDDGETISHFTGGANGDDNGEYWVVTTTDGTKYYFGLNRLPGWVTGDPTTQSAWTVPVFGQDPENPQPGLTFANSGKQQAYRWNLDYVVDPGGDALAYYYSTETNGYGQLLGKKVVPYTRGGTLARADYGFRDGSAYAATTSAAAPAARVVFGTADRCDVADCTPHTAAAWPDVPWDQSCATTATSCGTNFSPTFWSTKRLATVTTQVRNGTAYTPVDQWTFDQTYPDPGDGTGDGLWLHGVTHTGLVGGTASTPEVTFAGVTFQNRVNTAADGLPPMDKFRITSINNESGGTIDVQYAASDCDPAALPTPDANTTRCFPQIWTPAGDANPITDWFVKYVVAEVAKEDRVGGNPSQYTFYNYPAHGGAWHYNDNPLVPAVRRTWSIWRGFGTVQVVTGDPKDPVNPQSAVNDTYFRGMNGDHLADGTTRTATVTDSQGTSLTDSNQLAGMRREEITTNGKGGPLVTDEIFAPWQNGPTATQGPLSSFMVEVGKDVTRTALSPTGWRTTETDTTFNSHDQPVQVSDLGDTSTAADDQCTTTTYAPSATPNLVDLPAEVATVGATCSSTPSFPADAVSDEVKTFDPAGDALTTGEADGYTGTTPHFRTTDTSTYDSYGRVLTSTDAMGNKTSTSYGATVAASPAPTSETDVTNPLGKVSATVLSVATGQRLKMIDPAGNATTMTYDPLARLTQVWTPDRATTATPTEKFGYSVTNSKANYQSTSTLDANGSYQTSYTIYDGFLRQRQTQVPAHGSGNSLWRDITDTLYNSHGEVAQHNAAYVNAAAPSGTLQATDSVAVPHETLTAFDGADRPILESNVEFNVLAKDAAGNPWRTVTSYDGDHLDVTPPNGTTPTTTYSDARGNTTEVRQYHGATASGTFDSTTYTYTRAGQQATMTDAAGDVWKSSYDVLGDQTSVSDPDKGAATSTYDADGDLATTTDARGQTLAYTYDALGRKTGEYDGSVTGTQLASWTYDPNLGFTSSANSFVNGDEYSVTTGAVDAAGRPTQQSVVIPDNETGLAGTYTTKTTYEPDGSPNAVAVPAIGNLRAENLTYGYDSFGAPQSMSGTSFYVTSSTYGQDNSVEQLQFGPDTAAVWQTFTHDVPTDRLTGSSVQTLTSTGNVDAEEYGYDLSGNVTSQTDTVPGQAVDKQCFDYDYLQRLADAWTTAATGCGAAGSSVGGPAPYWQSYAYNLLGNRTKEVQHATAAGGTDTTTAYKYATAGHAEAVTGATTTGPSGTATASYGYNATGDTTSRPGPDAGTQSLAWNQNDQLGGVTEGGSTTASYVYDATGNRLITHDGTGATLFLPSGELHVNTAGTGATGTRYYSFAGQTVAQRAGTTLTYLTADDQGTSNLSVNPTTLVATKRRFDPFGNPRGNTAFPGVRGFVSGTNDSTTGLTHLGARDYDPTLGRFVSVDPVLQSTDPATINPYIYSQDNPATLSDPSGQLGVGACLSDGNGRCQTPPKPSKPTPRRTKTVSIPNHNSDGQIDFRFRGYHRAAIALHPQPISVHHASAPHRRSAPPSTLAPCNGFTAMSGGTCQVASKNDPIVRATDKAGRFVWNHSGTVAGLAGLACAALTWPVADTPCLVGGAILGAVATGKDTHDCVSSGGIACYEVGTDALGLTGVAVHASMTAEEAGEKAYEISGRILDGKLNFGDLAVSFAAERSGDQAPPASPGASTPAPQFDTSPNNRCFEPSCSAGGP